MLAGLLEANVCDDAVAVLVRLEDLLQAQPRPLSFPSLIPIARGLAAVGRRERAIQILEQAEGVLQAEALIAMSETARARAVLEQVELQIHSFVTKGDYLISPTLARIAEAWGVLGESERARHLLDQALAVAPHRDSGHIGPVRTNALRAIAGGSLRPVSWMRRSTWPDRSLTRMC